MEDIESEEIKAESIDQPILIFGVPLRFQNPKLILREFSRFVACIAVALTIISCLLSYMTRRAVYIDVQIGITLISFLIFIQHVLVYANLIGNGWGTPKGKFWCEVKIMIARGFNTIRTSLRLFITPLLFIVMSVEVGIKDPITILFLEIQAHPKIRINMTCKQTRNSLTRRIDYCWKNYMRSKKNIYCKKLRGGL